MDRIFYSMNFVSGHLAGIVFRTGLAYPSSEIEKRLAEFQEDERSQRVLTDLTGNRYTITNVKGV